MPYVLIWPPVPRAILRTALFIGYLAVALAGWDVTVNRTTNPGSHTGTALVIAIGYICAIGGTLATVGVVLQRWRLEFIAIAGVGAGLFTYNVIDWVIVLFGPLALPLRGPAIVTFALCLLIARGAYLHTFTRATTATKTARRIAPHART